MNMAFTNFFGIAMPVSSAAERKFTWTVSAENLLGTSGDDKFVGGAGNVMSGLAGDDIYEVKHKGDLIIEAASGGIDTAKVSKLTFYVLPDHVENLNISGRADAYGNGLGNIITGQANSQVLDGGGGNDYLSGGAGADTFQFSPGSGFDVIGDFSHADGDKIRLNTTALLTWDAVKAAMTQVGADVILRFDDDNAVRIRNTLIDSFDADDFNFRIDSSHLVQTFADDFDSYPELYDPDMATGTWTPHFNFGAPAGPNSRLSHTNNDELQVYVDPGYAGSGATPLGVDPFSVTDGVLTIKAQATPAEHLDELWGKTYTSGLLTTANSFYQQFGYFEMRAAMPKSQGVWPAFWLVPKDQTYGLELDVVEQIGTDVAYHTSHYWQDGVRLKTNFSNPVFDVSQFHTYGMLWTAKEIAWYIDGLEVASMDTPADLHKPMYIITNLALGGRWPGPLAADFTSAEMKIDYIHAFEVPPEAGTENINAIELNPGTELIGSELGEAIAGGSADDTLRGLGGDDVLSGLGGQDVLDGGSGVDTASYADAPSGVRVSLSLPERQYTGGAGADVLTSIENLLGSAYGDDLGGDGASNKLWGGAGDDLLTGGAGDDLLDGGAGNDTASYKDARGPAVVDLRLAGPQVTGKAGNDTLVSIEGLIGSGFTDKLWGNDEDNRLEGGDAADVLNAGAGADILLGGSGADNLTGGLGADVFLYTLASESKGSSFDTIVDFSRADGDLIDISGLDANQKKSGNQEFILIGTERYNFRPAELRYVVDSTGVHLYGDNNGDTSSDFHLFIKGATDLLYSDLIL